MPRGNMNTKILLVSLNMVPRKELRLPIEIACLRGGVKNILYEPGSSWGSRR